MASPSRPPSPSPSPSQSPRLTPAVEELEPIAKAADPPLPGWLAVLSVVVFTAVAAMSAVVEVLLVPVRVGSTVVPVSVALAVLSNISIPALSRRAVPAATAAALPGLAWIATVIALSQARPEGDVLLLGAPSPLVYVTYALLGVGMVTAVVTVVHGQARASGAGPPGR